MSEKTLGQVAFERFVLFPPAAPHRTWSAEEYKDSWESAAAAVRDAVMAGREDEVERLRAQLEMAEHTARTLAAENADLIARVERRDPEWVEWQEGLKLVAHRPVEVASLALDPGGSIAWTAGQHFGRVIGSGSKTLDLAKRIAEVAAGVSR